MCALGVVTVLLHEIISVYPLLVPANLNSSVSTRVCNALALLQCIASHDSTRGAFLQAHIPLYLYPFLNTTSKTRPFEYLRLTSLGVIGALVKSDNAEVIDFLLSTEIIPLCLRIMETGNELSRTVAIFIVQKILLDNVGLNYVCQTYERFHAVVSVLNAMVAQLQEQKSLRLLKHIIRCYLRLTDNKKALEGLKQILPAALRDDTFKPLIAEDANTTKFYEDLLARLT
jgi:CCR4-NOT transcription complex subunit 9